MANQTHSGWSIRLIVIGTVLGGLAFHSADSRAADTDILAEPTWQPTEAIEVRESLEDYLRTSLIPLEQQEAARAIWDRSGLHLNQNGDLLDRFAECLAPTDPRIAELVTYCAEVSLSASLPDFSWLADSRTAPLVRHNLRLYYARWLVQNNFDDEALAWTDGLDPADVIAPEALLFYRAVAQHRLVQADRADALVATLLEHPNDLPLRYQKLAELMQQDLAGLEDESLDHIARRMADVRRRLSLGRAGKTVQGVEQGVVESLDKLIQQLEEQAQQQASQSSAGGQPSGTPMQDSRPAPLKGPGQVEPRDVGHQADWGNLPDKDREQALQEIGRDFPSHYREVIEEYFRQLAAEPEDEGP